MHGSCNGWGVHIYTVKMKGYTSMTYDNLEMDRHAYLIICHGHWQILKLLLQTLDDERNDIYIHVDKKVNKFPEAELKSVVLKSKLIFVPRRLVNWGGYSQIESELSLLMEAIKTHHSYYHLLSGVDFPIKTQDVIHKFFDEHRGSNYIKYDWNSMKNNSHLERIREYHFFQEKIGRNFGKMAAFWWYAEEMSLKFQKIISVNRIKGRESKFFKGTNWFSITHEMASFVVSRTDYIEQNFRFSLCADEMFLQTVARSSPFRDSIVNDTLRFIDWQRGNPYIFRSADYDILLESNKLFARKFDENVDLEIVKRLSKHLTCNNDTCISK